MDGWIGNPKEISIFKQSSDAEQLSAKKIINAINLFQKKTTVIIKTRINFCNADADPDADHVTHAKKTMLRFPNGRLKFVL